MKYQIPIRLSKLSLSAALVLTISLSSSGQQKNIQVSLNENPYGPAKGVAVAIAKETAHIARYTGTEGDDLISAIAKREGVAPDQIVAGELLELLGVYLGLKGGKDSEFIYTVPGYPALVNAAARVGGVVVSVPLNSNLENDLPAIASKINAKTQAVFLVNPHNPSGTVSDNTAFHDFLSAASKQALVIVDEAYLEFSDDFAARTAVLNVKKGENVLVFRTFAKAYGLAGLSLGYAVAPKALAAYLKGQGLGGLHDLNRLSISAALASLKDESYLPEIHQHITQERKKWTDFLDKQGLQHTNSAANFVFFDTKKPYDVVAGKLKAQGIVIGRAFEPYSTWIRITIGLPEENLKVRGAISQIIN